MRLPFIIHNAVSTSISLSSMFSLHFFLKRQKIVFRNGRVKGNYVHLHFLWRGFRLFIIFSSLVWYKNSLTSHLCHAVDVAFFVFLLWIHHQQTLWQIWTYRCSKHYNPQPPALFGSEISKERGVCFFRTSYVCPSVCL